MKRTPLLRKTPLARAKPLKPGKALTRGAPLKRGKPMAKKRPKRKNAERSEEYLAFVRSQPCMVDGCREKDIEAHHFETEGMGLKCSDFKTAPLCGRKHHRGSWHQKGELPGGTRAEWMAKFRAKALELQAAFRGTE